MNAMDKLFYAVLIVATVVVLLWMSPECVPGPPTAPNSLEEILDEPNDDNAIVELDASNVFVMDHVEFFEVPPGEALTLISEYDGTIRKAEPNDFIFGEYSIDVKNYGKTADLIRFTNGNMYYYSGTDEPNDAELLQAAIEEATKYAVGTIEIKEHDYHDAQLEYSPAEIDRWRAQYDEIADEIIESIARRPEAIARLRELVCQKEDPNEVDLFQFNIVDYNDALDLTQVTGSGEVYITAVELVASDPEAIRKLAKDGCICKILGHQWKRNTGIFTADHSPYTGERVCGLCGEWETAIYDSTEVNGDIYWDDDVNGLDEWPAAPRR